MNLMKQQAEDRRWAFRKSSNSSLKILDIKIDNISPLDGTLEDFKSMLKGIIQKGNIYIGINFSEIILMTSECIQFILECNNDCKARGGKLYIIAPRTNVQRLFSLTGADKTLAIVKNEGYASLYT